MDECCLLPSQLLVPNLDWLPASDGLVSRLQPKQPLRLRFGRTPTLPSSTSTLQLDGLTRYAAHPSVLPHTPPSPASPWRSPLQRRQHFWSLVSPVTKFRALALALR